jgi:hypothetical protein
VLLRRSMQPGTISARSRFTLTAVAELMQPAPTCGTSSNRKCIRGTARIPTGVTTHQQLWLFHQRPHFSRNTTGAWDRLAACRFTTSSGLPTEAAAETVSELLQPLRIGRAAPVIWESTRFVAPGIDSVFNTNENMLRGCPCRHPFFLELQKNIRQNLVTTSLKITGKWTRSFRNWPGL